MKSILLIIMLFIFVGCGADSPEMPVKEAQEPIIAQEPIDYFFGDQNSPPWETRIKPGMSQIEVLKIWGKPWSAYKYQRTIYASERDAWCYYTLGGDFAIVLWAYDPVKWNAPVELSAAIWGKGTGVALNNPTIYGAINDKKFLLDEEEIKRLYTHLYINYWKVKL